MPGDLCLLSHLIFVTNQWHRHYYFHLVHEETGPKVKLLVSGNTPRKSQSESEPAACWLQTPFPSHYQIVSFWNSAN